MGRDKKERGQPVRLGEAHASVRPQHVERSRQDVGDERVFVPDGDRRVSVERLAGAWIEDVSDRFAIDLEQSLPTRLRELTRALTP